MKGYLFSDLLIPPYFEEADGGNESEKRLGIGDEKFP